MMSMATNFDTPEDYNEELLEFYARFDEKNDILGADIVDYEILEGDGVKFAVYIIEIRTSLIKYKVQKRYSQFHNLKEKIRVEFPNINLNEVKFPGKQYFGNLKPETLTTRKVILNQFIQWLCMKHQDSPIIDFLEFLEIRTRYYLNINQIHFSMMNKEESQNNDSDILLGYLEQLNKDASDSCKILKEMADFFEDKKGKLNFDIVKKLIMGCKKTKGLLSFCGKYNEETNTHLICCVGLPFLVKLMRFDLNQDAEKFLEVFGNLPSKQLTILNLEAHIEGKIQRSCKESAFELIDIFLTCNPSLSCHSILYTEESQKEYRTWKLRFQNSSKKVEQYHVPEFRYDNPDSAISKSYFYTFHNK